MKSTNPLFIAKNKLADKIRCGDESAETRQAYELALTAYEATRPSQISLGDKWYHSPVAAACWNGDSKDLRA